MDLPAAWINLMFLVVYVVAVTVDPLFFYLPVINEATKCIAIDNTLKITAICVRSFLDFIAFGDLVRRSKRDHDGRKRCSDFVINILGILPVPQVLLPMIFSGMSGSKFRNIRKFLNAAVILQYVPRLLRICRLWNKAVSDAIKKPTKTGSSTTEEEKEKEKEKKKKKKKEKKKYMVVKAGLNLYLYLVASHVLGAFWYFFSIERETSCWHLACEHDIECIKGTSCSFHCGDVFRNYPILNDYCSLKNPNTTLFDFGIFQKARQSGILDSMDFPRKSLFCFWWGLRNLSSFGQNLETSPNYWENCFTVLISIFGLLLFLYFIGNLQVYMQSETSDALKTFEQPQAD